MNRFIRVLRLRSSCDPMGEWPRLCRCGSVPHETKKSALPFALLVYAKGGIR
jgi:hypothetical protein